ncbi:hypothetical protein IJ768_02660 [Candidatus Saccharibacteria bacterium]|nr:hypothetical protein [Candidatus Saccharibacteria bacterium]
MSDTQNDDLQNAINGIVNGTVDGATADATMPDLGEAPVPPMTGDATPEMALPTMPVPDPAAGLMNAAPESIEDQAAAEEAPKMPEAVEPEPVDGTLSETAVDTIAESVEKMPSGGNGGISDIKKDMISDLIPLMDKVSLAPEKQFGFYKELIDATHNKDLVPGAYTAAKKISDDATRAEALLYLIDEAA